MRPARSSGPARPPRQWHDRRYRAAWVCPIDRPPIRERHRRDRRRADRRDPGSGIREPASDGSRIPDPGSRDLGNVAILPGLINAHTHLELSWLRGRVPPANRLHRLGEDAGRDPARDRAADHARRWSRRCTTPFASCARREPWRWATSPTRSPPSSRCWTPVCTAWCFTSCWDSPSATARSIEATREQRAAAARPRRARSASRRTRRIRLRLNCSRRSARRCPHRIARFSAFTLANRPKKWSCSRQGSGPWRGMLQTIGVWRDDWEVPACGPVQFLDRHGVIDARTLVVHGVQFDDAALERLRELGATLVTCPRSNRWVGAGYPPIERFYRSGVADGGRHRQPRERRGPQPVLRAEDDALARARRCRRGRSSRAPRSSGAKALGLDRELGSITPGKRAELIAVRAAGRGRAMLRNTW